VGAAKNLGIVAVVGLSIDARFNVAMEAINWFAVAMVRGWVRKSGALMVGSELRVYHEPPDGLT
jgi:hypothetical protein